MIGRIVATLAAVAAVVAPLALLGQRPAEVPSQETATFDVLPAELPVACPGQERLPIGDDAATEGDFASGSTDVKHGIYTAGSAVPEPAGSGYLASADVGTEVERIGTGDIAGLAAVTCLTPREDSWLVGGATTTGASSRLVLTNPTDASSDVMVTLYGPDGPVDEPQRLAVGARSQESVLLEGVADGLPSMAVHVEATGSGVTATLQDSRLDGFLPAGSDWIAAAEGPATRLVMPGVGPSLPEEGAGPVVVRLFSEAGARVNLSYVVDGEPVAWPAGTGVAVGAGEALDVEVPAGGMGTILVDANAPVLAAAQTRVVRDLEDGLEGDRAWDFAWTAGQQYRETESRVAVAGGYTATLVVYADAAGTYRLLDESGRTVARGSVAEAGTSTAELATATGRTLTMESSVPITWAIRLTDEPGFITVLTPADVTILPVPVDLLQGVYVP